LPTQVPVVTTPTGRIKARRVVPKGKEEGGRFRYGGRIRQANWGRLVIMLVIVLVVALVSGSAYAYIYLPEGTVSVTPLGKTITDMPIEISVITSPTPDNLPTFQPSNLPTFSEAQSVQTGPTITAAWIHSPLTEEGTRPASG